MKLYTSSVYRVLLTKCVTPLIIYGKKNCKMTNIEHIVPQSVSINRICTKDMHMMFLSNIYLNGIRNNYKYIDERDIKEGDKVMMYNKDGIYEDDVDRQHCGIISGKRKFIPPKESRGIISRSILYYRYKYGGDIKRVIDEDILYEWGKKYKVEEEEYRRNREIYYFQENVNPFIEDNDLIERYI